ncbi:MAG: PKD domain-containing protein [Planctomycetota bacterium]
MSYFEVKIERDRMEIKKGGTALLPVSITNIGTEPYDTKVRVEGQRAGSASWYTVLDRDHKPVEMKTLQPKDNVTYYLQAQIPATVQDPNDTLEVIAYDVENSGSVWSASGKLEIVFKEVGPDPVPWWIWVIVAGVGLGLVGVILWLLLSGDEFVADFEVSAAVGPAPLVVQFTDKSQPRDPAPESWKWTFGDGSEVSTEQNPSHTFTSPAKWVVTLEVRWPSGGSDQFEGAIVQREVVVTQPPGAEFTALPDKGRSPLEVRFSDVSSGTIGRWEWDFGDGSAKSTEQNPTHTFTNPTAQDQVRTVTLKVTDTQGATATTTGTVTVGPESEVRLAMVEGDAEVSAARGYAPFTVQFKNKSTNTPAVLWDFGDQSTTTDADPTHKYESPGSYTVTLSSPASGAKDTGQVHVYTQPEITMTVSATEIMREDEVTFDLNGTGDFESSGALLKFGDGAEQEVSIARPRPIGRVREGIEMVPVHTIRKLIKHKYNSSGTWDATLIARGKAGNEIVRTVAITVKPKPGDRNIRIMRPVHELQPVRFSGN